MIFQLIPTILLNQFYFFMWRDALEILFFSIIVYAFSLWLKKDQQKNLLPYFYGYSLLFFLVQVLQLTSISAFLIIFAPVVLMLFIIFHQELLQRNFVMLRAIIPATKTQDSDWIEILFRVILQMLNQQKELIIVIQNQNDLHSIIQSPFELNTPMQLDLFNMLLQGTSYDHAKYIWITAQGTLIAINAHPAINIHEQWITSEVTELESWQQEGLLITTKTDALILKSDHKSRSVSIVAQGKLSEGISCARALNIIRTYLKKSSLPHQPKGDTIYGAQNKKSVSEQSKS